MNRKVVLIILIAISSGFLISGCVQQETDNSQRILQGPKTGVLNESIQKNIEYLEKTGDNNSIELLIKMFGDTDELIQQNAMNAVVNIGTPAVDQLIQSLQSPDVNIRICSTNVLGRIGDKRAIEPIKQLFNDPNQRVREEAQISYSELVKYNSNNTST